MLLAAMKNVLLSTLASVKWAEEQLLVVRRTVLGGVLYNNDLMSAVTSLCCDVAIRT